MTEQEIILALEKVDRAIDNILLGGQSWNINSGGGSRSTTFANLADLKKMRSDLEYKLSLCRGEAGCRLGASW
jgi:hypothetical protein